MGLRENSRERGGKAKQAFLCWPKMSGQERIGIQIVDF